MSAVTKPLVFISHTTSDPRDSQRAHRLARELKKRGAKTWIAPDSIPAGSQWEEKLVSAIIDECTHFLIILSAASIRSAWVLKELELARRRGTFDVAFTILPLVVGELDRFKGSKFVAGLQQIPYLENFPDQLQAVVLSIGLRAGTPGAMPLILLTTDPDLSRMDIGWISYKRRQASLVGRESELAALRDFYDSPGLLKWWVIDGPGGIGKSRLALESLLALPDSWDRGFLETSGVDERELVKSIPESPTAIVVDDAASAVRLVDLFIRHLERSHELTHKIRILLLERATESQRWWAEIRHDGGDSHAERIASLYGAEPLSLERLDPSQQRLALAAFIAFSRTSAPVELPDADDPFWSHIDMLSDHGRPLYLGLVAAAVSELGIEHLRSWKTTALLDFVYDHEMRAWERLCPDHSLRRQVQNIVAIATASRGFNFERYENQIRDCLKSADLAINDESGVWQAVYTLTGSTTSVLEPDILGEYYLTRIWDKPKAGPAQPLLEKMLAAFDLRPAAVTYTIRNAVADFPESEVPLWWMEALARQRFNKDHKLRIMEMFTTSVRVYAAAGEFGQMERCLAAIRDWTRGITEFSQEHNNLSEGAAIAVHQYAAAGRFQQAQEWMETSRALGAQFPSFVNLQADLVRSAIELISQAGEAKNFEAIERAIGPLEDVARRQIHLRARDLANGAATAAFQLLESDLSDAIARCLRIMQRLHNLRGGIDESWVLPRFAAVAFAAVLHGLRLRQWGLMAWGFVLLSKAHDAGSSNENIVTLFTGALRKHRSDPDAHQQGRLLAQAEDVSGKLSREAEQLTVEAAEALLEETRSLVCTHAENWFLAVYHARALSSAIAIYAAAGDITRGETALEELRGLRKEFPESMDIRRWAALGVTKALSPAMSFEQINILLDELRSLDAEARAQFWHDWEMAWALALALRRAVQLHIHASRPQHIQDLIDELERIHKLFPWVDEFAADLATAVQYAVGLYAGTGSIERIKPLTDIVLGLRDNIKDDEQTRSHVAEALHLAIEAYRAAGLEPEARDLQVALENLPTANERPAENPSVIKMQAISRDSFSPGGIESAMQKNI